MSIDTSFLRSVDMFAGLSETDLQVICSEAEELYLAPGENVFSEGDLSDRLYVIQSGELEIIKISNGRPIQLAVRGEGTLIGEMSLLAATPRTASARATRETKLICFPRGALIHLLESSPSASMKILDTVIERLRSNELMLRQSERMAQLGELTAGIAHELNNPAAAVRRGAEQLATALAWSRRSQREAERLGIEERVLEAITGFVNERFAHQTPITSADPITRADQITELEGQLDQYGVSNSWEVAPELIDMGADLREVEKLLPGASPEVTGAAIDWLAASFSVRSILKGIEQGADQISEIIKALKTYSYMDQAPSQLVDIHEGLDNTLIMLRHMWKKGVLIERNYDPALPRILAYGSELNQVWTNILANAIEAMDGRGKVKITTSAVNGGVQVEIEDNGPGIPTEEQPKIFGLFHTTKPVGKGTGLGLNISYRIVQKHGGKIGFESEVGRTVFRVWIPVTGDW